jgi:hypothetical protein
MVSWFPEAIPFPLAAATIAARLPRAVADAL